jgi:hypothetical protein
MLGMAPCTSSDSKSLLEIMADMQLRQQYTLMSREAIYLFQLIVQNA